MDEKNLDNSSSCHQTPPHKNKSRRRLFKSPMSQTKRNLSSTKPSPTPDAKSGAPCSPVSAESRGGESGEETAMDTREHTQEATGTLGSIVRKILARKECAARRKGHNSEARKFYQDNYPQDLKQRRKNWAPNWEVILQDLQKYTPTHGQWLKDAVRVHTTKASAQILLFGIDDHLQEIGSRYGCSVRIENGFDTTQHFPTFLLSGSTVAISCAVADILTVAPDTKVKVNGAAAYSSKPSKSIESTQSDSTQQLSPIDANLQEGKRERWVLSTMKTRGSKLTCDAIPRPEQWTKQSFLDYVTAVTLSKVPSHYNHIRRQRVEPRIHALDLLRQLFRSPHCRAAITREACHVALQFFSEHHDLGLIRELFVVMEILKVSMVPETFNIILRSAAKDENAHAFHFWLHLMLERGIAPNGSTWTAFMACQTELRVKALAFQAMHTKGLLTHIHVIKAVCQELIPYEIASSLHKEQDQETFISHMDHRYTSKWLNVSSGNMVLQELASRGLMFRCKEFLDFMDSRSIAPDQVSIHTIIRHCKGLLNVRGALYILRTLSPSTKYTPDEETYRIWFDLAWRIRAYNLLRVAWRYACLSAATDYRMRRDVYASLGRAVVSNITNMTPTERWDRFAGPIIVGVGNTSWHPSEVVLGHTPLNQLSSAESEDLLVSKHLMLPFSMPTSASSEAVDDPTDWKSVRSATYAKMKASLHRQAMLDYKTFDHWTPKVPFEEMLARAIDLDDEWRRTGAHKEKNWKWLAQNAIPIPLRRKGYSGATHSWTWR